MAPCVGAIIEHSELGFLLRFRDEGAPACPLTWTTFGGYLEEGESPEEALWRELEEEIEFTRVMALSCQLVQFNTSVEDFPQHVYHIDTQVTTEQLVLHEGSDMRYFRAEELFTLPFAFNIEQIYRDHLNGRRDF